MSSRLARVRTAANTASAQALTPAFYAKVVGISFAVGACMELFMVKTGFYAVATRKEAERRAMAQWELEEQKRASVERSRRRQERERQDREQYRERLRQELTALRRKEVETGVKLDADKALVKRQLREIASRSQTDSGH